MNNDNGRERRDILHKMHCNINARQTEIRKENKDEWEHWLYEAYRLGDTMRGVAARFKRLREGTLPTAMRYCSHSPVEELPSQKLTCALGVNVAECPILRDVFVNVEATSPEILDELKATICAGHIFKESVRPGHVVDTSEGYILDESDRAFWDKTYAYLAMEEPS